MVLFQVYNIYTYPLEYIINYLSTSFIAMIGFFSLMPSRALRAHDAHDHRSSPQDIPLLLQQFCWSTDVIVLFDCVLVFSRYRFMSSFSATVLNYMLFHKTFVNEFLCVVRRWHPRTRMVLVKL